MRLTDAVVINLPLATLYFTNTDTSYFTDIASLDAGSPLVNL